MQPAIRKERMVDAVLHMVIVERPPTTAEPAAKVAAHLVEDLQLKKGHQPQLNKSPSSAAPQPQRSPRVKSPLTGAVALPTTILFVAIGLKGLVALCMVSVVKPALTAEMVAKADLAQVLQSSRLPAQSRRQRLLTLALSRFSQAVSPMCKLVLKLCMQGSCQMAA